MTGPPAGPLVELKALRKGRGVFAPQLADHVGPVLRGVCGVGDRDDTATIRRKLIERLSELAAALPDDLGLAATVALAIHPEARQAFLNQRIQWLANHISRDGRTARRRVDDGIVQLAEVAADRYASGQGPGPRSEHWYVSQLRAVVLLDRSSPWCIETRRIVAGQDNLDRLTLAVSLPRDPAADTGPHDLGVEVLYGGVLAPKRLTGASQFRFELRLPHALRSGESHEFALTLKVPDSQPMRSHYVHTSPRRCDSFELRIRFGPGHQQRQVWRVDGLFHRELDELTPAGELLRPDPAGDLYLDFANLAPGFAYGVQWSDGNPRH